MAVARDQLTIVIPTLNEERGIGVVLEELKCCGGVKEDGGRARAQPLNRKRCAI